MADRYAELRAALDQTCHALLIDDPDTIRALLAERDDVLENGKQAVRWAPSSAHWSNELKRLFGEDAREGIDALEARLRAAQAERDALREALDGLVGDIESLAAESDGVAGFHQNGDLATWAELMPGGRFEWLEHMDKARAALAKGEA